MDYKPYNIDIEDISKKWNKINILEENPVIITLLDDIQSKITSDINANHLLIDKICRKINGISKLKLYKYYIESIKNNILIYNQNLIDALTTKVGKTTSGIVSITVVTSPGRFSCPQDCHYCPNEPGMPRSYVSTGPSVLRAIKVNFDIVQQFRDRAFCLINMGHEITKIELIIIGGTWSYHPITYQEELMQSIYYAANTFYTEARTILPLEEEIKINETAKSRIIGITIETRPDHITKEELIRLRRYGVTRVQLGVQHIDDDILHMINRKCTTAITYKAFKLLKENGFKVDAHYMPDLPGSSYDKDLDMFKFLFSRENEGLQADQLKIYPTMVTKYTKIEELYKNGLYKPYGDIDNSKYIFDLILYITCNVPRWIRLNRVVRDIPSGVIEGKFKETSLYQRILKHMVKHDLEGTDIRFREVKLDIIDQKDCDIFITSYRSSEGNEYFISYETLDKKKLLGFLRLRINDDLYSPIFPELHKATLVRELHVYGKLVNQSTHNKHFYQHKGIGKKLLEKAEEITLEQNIKKIAIISGTGAREYYKKHGYVLEGTYMCKNL